MDIGFLLFPNLTQLDLTGPLQVLHRLPGACIHLLAKDLAPVPSDCGLGLVPTCALADAPQLDVLCVPGGFGVSQAMQDRAIVEYIQRVGSSARYLTSVCTGAFLLGVAGLLQGRRATTHWAYHPLLARVGAIPTRGRVVRDGNLFTGGGVTAGIDFAFSLAAELSSPEAAQRIQLALEYDPLPPFEASQIESNCRQSVSDLFRPRIEEFAAQLDQVVHPSANPSR